MKATAEAPPPIEARRLAQDLIIQPDAIAVDRRDASGDYHVHTQHHMSAAERPGHVLGPAVGLLFFIPVFGIAIGAGKGALMGKITSRIDKEFQDQVRAWCSRAPLRCSFMVEKVTPDKAIDAMSKFGAPC